MDLTSFAAVIALFGLVVYVFLDGMDLGVGILFPFFNKEDHKNKMMSSIAPFWDGNETWLIYAGSMVWALFPAIYAIVLPALYIPASLMLFFLALRGVSFEFRLKTQSSKRIKWDLTFFIGSLGAAITQGIMLGCLFDKIEIQDGYFSGSQLAWLSYFPFLTGVSVACAYCLTGLGWLICKTDGEVNAKSRKFFRMFALFMLALFLCNAMYVLEKYRFVLDRLINLGFLGKLLIALNALNLLTLLAIAVRGVKNIKNELIPILLSIFIFAVSLVSAVASFWPYVFYPTHTIYDLVNSSQSVKFALWVICISLPMVIAYTAYVYWVFRFKTKKENSNIFYEGEF